MHPRSSPFLPESVPYTRRSWTEFDAEAALHNVRFARSLHGEDRRIMAIVKADAYGHGMARMARAIANEVHSFGVACVGEAGQLREAGILTPIFLLSPALPQEMADVVQGRFRPPISTLAEGAAFNALAHDAGVILPVQWNLDTGMGRIGTLPSDWKKFAPNWTKWPQLRLESICTHYPSADEDPAFTRAQGQAFRAIISEMDSMGIHPDFVHLANSAGALGFTVKPNELLRTGLLLYGASPLPEFQPKLRPVLTWKTSVALVRQLPEGWGVSYGSTHLTQRPTQVATLAVGYADGFLRHLTHSGAAVLIHGQRCPLLGRVTMDQIMVDVSHLSPLPQPGSEVVLLGSQGTEAITVSELASQAGTIPWEIFTSIRSK